MQAERQEGGRKVLDVVADRFRLGRAERARALEAIEVALRRGGGQIATYVLADEGEKEGLSGQDSDKNSGEPLLWRFSTRLHCPESGRRYHEPSPSMFFFNSPMSACEACRGFGRVIGADWAQ